MACFFHRNDLQGVAELTSLSAQNPLILGAQIHPLNLGAPCFKVFFEGHPLNLGGESAPLKFKGFGLTRNLGPLWQPPGPLVAQCSATPATVAATPPCSATPFQTQISVRHLPAQGGGGEVRHQNF